jgi:hypothetical protein
MQRKNSGKAMCYLVLVCALVSALAMVGCGGGGGDEGGGSPVTSGETLPNVDTGTQNLDRTRVQALEKQQFTFPGSIFDPSLGNNTATLTFTGPTQNGEAFTLTSGGATSSGETTFGSCTFAFTQGPLAGKSVKFNICTIQITAGAVTAGGGPVTGTLMFTLSGGPFGGATVVFTVQISILADGTLVINGVSSGIIISSDGTPTTGTTGTGTTGTGGTP